MRWALLVMVAALGLACPRGPTGPVDRAPSTIPGATLPADAPPAPAATVDAAGDVPDAPPAPPTAEEEARFEACAEACTMYAVCYELVYGEDYVKGSHCMSECEDLGADDLAAFLKSAAAIEPLRGKRRQTACERLIGE